ncbi:hypothetical protein M409DRAFT_15919 [Zasmidium cellare ATCC 36951]|uniref:DNA2/NAM7 helicase helicase domain-containing protein n=1 Tax=Zasmidium cellare ATCC 36951 TaxID=1080233 RepID=A0A6A6D2N6_ZASCE|nr:uncharacterized protein M409DRAFT_15919 [Zasmidium cellare ATCC 36951]KAF2173641.1 hypothetical protein M409DRAFT_15919 [Zasmidium cellare ATCC 36951]
MASSPSSSGPSKGTSSMGESKDTRSHMQKGGKGKGPAKPKYTKLDLDHNNPQMYAGRPQAPLPPSARQLRADRFRDREPPAPRRRRQQGPRQEPEGQQEPQPPNLLRRDSYPGLAGLLGTAPAANTPSGAGESRPKPSPEPVATKPLPRPTTPPPSAPPPVDDEDTEMTDDLVEPEVTGESAATENDLIDYSDDEAVEEPDATSEASVTSKDLIDYSDDEDVEKPRDPRAYVADIDDYEDDMMGNLFESEEKADEDKTFRGNGDDEEADLENSEDEEEVSEDEDEVTIITDKTNGGIAGSKHAVPVQWQVWKQELSPADQYLEQDTYPSMYPERVFGVELAPLTNYRGQDRFKKKHKNEKDWHAKQRCTLVVTHQNGEKSVFGLGTSEIRAANRKAAKEAVMQAASTTAQELETARAVAEGSAAHASQPGASPDVQQEAAHAAQAVLDAEAAATEAGQAAAALESEMDLDDEADVLEKEQAFVWLRYETASQTPAVILEVDLAMPGSSESQMTECHLFGNSVKAHYTYEENNKGNLVPVRDHTGFSMMSSDDGKAGKDMLRALPDELKATSVVQRVGDPAQGACLHSTAIELWSIDEAYEASEKNVLRTRPKFTRVELELLRYWHEQSQSVEGMTFLSPGKMIAASVFRAAKVEILTGNLRKHGDQFDKIRDYMQAGMAATCAWGPYWQYELQLQDRGQTMSNRGLKLKHLQVPRQLVTTWKVGLDNRGFVIPKCIVPIEWAALHKTPVHPTTEAGKFILSLAETREEEKRQDLLVKAMNDARVEAQFAEFDEQYLVYLRIEPNEKFVDQSGAEVELKMLLPVSGHPFRVRIAGSEMMGEKLWFSGIITEDDHDPQYHLSARVKYVGNEEFTWPEDRDTFAVRVKFWSDNKPTSRKIRAVEALTDGQFRKYGVDFQALFFGLLPNTSKPGWVKDFIERHGKQELLNTVRGELTRVDAEGQRVHNLNKEQLDAWNAALEGDKGATLIHGPPGTGKTKVLRSMLDSYRAANLKVAVVAGANSQVDQVRDAWVSRDTTNSKAKGRYVRVYNKHFQPRAIAEKLAQWETQFGVLDEGEAPTVAVDDSFAQVAAEALFELQVLPNEFGKRARDYVQYLKDLCEASGKAKKGLLKKLRNLEDKILPHICSKVDIWFVTANSSGIYQLAEFARPDVIIVEEAGLASAAEIAVPMAAWKNSAKTIVFAGDSFQQKPLCTSSERNEGGD